MMTRVLAGMIWLGVLLSAESPVGAATKPQCTPVSLDLGLTAGTPGGTGLNDFPVFVHYMINDGFLSDDPSQPLPSPVPIGSASYPPTTVQGYFAPTGLFNQIWSAQGITFVLVGIETCTFNLPSLDPALPNDRRFPSPELRRDLPLAVFKRYNATHYQVGSGTRPFKGLDLYIFWSIRDAAGYATSPKFKTVSGTTQAVQTAGGAFLDGDCQNAGSDGSGPPGDGCRREFSHEAGHFFSLCHCCSTGLTPISQTGTCTTQYCPDVVTAGTSLPDCNPTSGPSLASRLMATNWLHDQLTACEITRALGTAQQILK